jgi:hypothetical protein
VLSVSQYLSLSKPLPVKREWRLFYPLYRNWPAGRYRAGGEPGSALTKSKQKIAFIDIQIECTIQEPVWKLFFYKPTEHAQFRPQPTTVEASVTENGQRWRALATPPPIIKPFLVFPEVLVLFAV